MTIANLPAELPSDIGPTRRDLALWIAAGVSAVCLHAAVAWSFHAFAPPDIPPNAVEQALEIEMSPLEVSTPDAVKSEAVLEETQPETVEPVEEVEQVEPTEPEARAEPTEPEARAEPTEPEAQAEPIEPETVAELIPPDAVLETPAEETPPPEPETVTEVQPEPELTSTEMVQPEVAEIVVPEVVLPPPPKPKELEVRKAEVKPKKVEPKKKSAPAPKKVDPAPRTEVASKSAPKSEASVKSTASKAPTISPARWQSRVVSHINRHKRYPGSARARGDRGTVVIAFAINASGAVTAAHVSRSSGSADLDRAAVDMVRRASPVPAPPPEIARGRMDLSIPVSFTLR